MSFKLFDHLDKALVGMEKRDDWTSKSARLWPSESSAQLLEPTVAGFAGGCGRKVYYRLTGEKTTSQMDPVGARRVRTGKAVEEDTTLQAMEAGLHIASGVRHYVPNIDLAFELDLVVIDPVSGQPVICENKSIYGFMAQKEIIGNSFAKGRPKLEHVLQTLIYINEIRSGANLKQIIAAAQADKPTNPRNRVRVTDVNLGMIKDDATVYGKICYETRDTCLTAEFDIEIYEDYDGLHYPQVNGEVWRIFTVESIYERFEQIQGYFNRSQAEAIRRLQEQGTVRPASLPTEATEEAVIAWKAQEKGYWERVGEEMRRLPVSYLPPADYRYRYTDVAIESFAEKGFIGKTKFAEWKSWKNGKSRKWKESKIGPIIGDWQCRYCPYKFPCIALEYPDLAPMVSDMLAAQEEEETEEAERKV